MASRSSLATMKMSRRRIIRGIIVLIIVAVVVGLLLKSSRTELLKSVDGSTASKSTNKDLLESAVDSSSTKQSHGIRGEETTPKEQKNHWPPLKSQRVTIRPPPVKQTAKLASVPTYQVWNHKTQRLDLPHPRPDSFHGPFSNLEILQRILETVDWKVDPNPADTCFLPASDETRALAMQVSNGQERISYPILYVGMPKMGSTSLHAFFQCSGIRSSHAQNGRKMKTIVDAGLPHPLTASQLGPPPQAYSQLDYNFDDCAYPQIQFLDEIHQEFPHSTFILNFRPMLDWIHSVEGWSDMAERWRACRLPGLVCTGQRDVEGRRMCTPQNLAQWWCGHARHIREFVQQYPTHKLVEIDLYDQQGTAQILSQLFGADETCWMHVNKNDDVYGQGTY